MHRLSIVTVTFNDLENLKRTYCSLAEQGNRDFEWIVKDGASTDGTGDYLADLAAHSDTDIHVFSGPDSSRYDAMNQATGHVTGEYVLFLNAGDILADPGTLGSVLEVLEKCANVDFVYGDSITVTGNGTSFYTKARDLSYLSNSLPTSHQAILYNSRLFETYSYPPEYRIASDYALTARIYFDGNDKFIRLPFAVCRFFLGGESTVRRDILLREGYEIHRRIAGNGIMLAGAKFIKRRITFFLLDRLPIVYRILR